MNHLKAQSKMDFIRLILGMIGFVVIILIMLVFIQSKATTNLTGSAVNLAASTLSCSPNQVIANNKCQNSQQVSGQQSPDITYEINKNYYHMGGETTINITVTNNAAGTQTYTILPPYVIRTVYTQSTVSGSCKNLACSCSNGYQTSGNSCPQSCSCFKTSENQNIESGQNWSFSYDSSVQTVDSGGFYTWHLTMKTPDSSQESGDYFVEIPIQSSQGIIFKTINISLALPLNLTVRLQGNQTLSSLTYYSGVRPCPDPYLIMEKSPQGLSDSGAARIIIPFCNYQNYQDSYIVTPIATNYNYYQYNIYQNCSAKVTVRANSNQASYLEDYLNPVTCEIPVYNSCKGQIHLSITTNYPEKTNAVENHGWLLSEQGYCFLQPNDVFIKSISFNNSKNSPAITSDIVNRFGARDVTVDFNITNTDNKQVTVCSIPETMQENEEKIVTCKIQRNGYPYSFWGTGFLGANTVTTTAYILTNGYQVGNSFNITSQPSFEFVNVSINKTSLRFSNDPKYYYGNSSFEINNNGDKGKTVNYQLWAKKINNLTDPNPTDYMICSGSVSVAAASSKTVSCITKNQKMTFVSCDPSDGCIYNGSRTLWANISVDHQEAAAFSFQQQAQLTSNNFIAPIYEEVGIETFGTPVNQ